MTNAERLMTAAEVAQRYNVHPETVRRWSRDGKLRSVRLGTGRKGLRFRFEDVEALVTEQASS